MPSTKEFNNRILNDGHDDTQLGLSGSGEVTKLLNLRPFNGRLEQTKPLYGDQFNSSLPGQIRVCDYAVDSSNQPYRWCVGETTCGKFDKESTLLSYTELAYWTPTYAPWPIQTAENEIDDDYFCFVEFLGSASIPQTLAISIDVGGTTFSWVTTGPVGLGAGVAITTSGVYLSAINANVWFKTATNTAGRHWNWSSIGSKAFATPLQGFAGSKTWHNGDIFVSTPSQEILKFRNDGFVTSVGEQKIFGKYVKVFYNHLVVGGYSQATLNSGGTALISPNYANSTPWQLAWSDLNALDTFKGTLINEADTFKISSKAVHDGSSNGITGMEGWKNQLFIYTADTIYSMTYVGLPNVMLIEDLHVGVGSLFQNGVVATNKGHFFIGRDNFYYFDGVAAQAIGNKVKKTFFNDLDKNNDRYQHLFGFFDTEKEEVVWTYWKYVATASSKKHYIQKQICLQINTGEFYFKNLSYSTSPSSGATGSDDSIYCATSRYNKFGLLAYYGKDQQWLEVDESEISTLLNFHVTTYKYSSPYYLSATGTNVSLYYIRPDYVQSDLQYGWTKPYMETNNIFYDDIFHMNEIDGVVLAADAPTLSTVGNAGIQVSYSASLQPADDPTMVDLALFTPSDTSVINLLDCRKEGRFFKFKIMFQGFQPLYNKLYAFGEQAYKWVKAEK